MSDVTLGILRHTDLKIECYDENEKLIWLEKIHNLVVDEGLNDSLDKYFKGSNYTAAHYVGLTTDSKTFAEGDSMSSHAGWTEFTKYDGDNRMWRMQCFTNGIVYALVGDWGNVRVIKY